MQVVALIDEENGRYGVTFPDFPGCTTTADSLDGAVARAAEVLASSTSRDLPNMAPLPQPTHARRASQGHLKRPISRIWMRRTLRPVHRTGARNDRIIDPPKSSVSAQRHAANRGRDVVLIASRVRRRRTSRSTHLPAH